MKEKHSSKKEVSKLAAKAKNVNIGQKSLGRRLYQYRWVYLLGLPGLLLMLFFNYLPMRGLLMAFQNYNPHLGILGSE